MSKRIPKLILIDMLVCVENLINYTKGMTFESFLLDSKTKDAVMRNIGVLGEAAKKLPEDFKALHHDVEWGKIIRSRHIAIHEYDSVDYSIVWKIITVHAVPLKKALEKILKDIDPH